MSNLLAILFTPSVYLLFISALRLAPFVGSRSKWCPVLQKSEQYEVGALKTGVCGYRADIMDIPVWIPGLILAHLTIVVFSGGTDFFDQVDLCQAQCEVYCRDDQVN